LRLLKSIGLTAVGAVVLVAMVLFLLGRRPGAGSNEAEVEIARPVSQVFPWLIEPEKLTQWIEGLVESTPLTADGVRIGARSREVIMEGGQRYEMESEITGFEPNRHLRVKVTSTGFDVDGRYDLLEQNGNTRLNYVGVAYYKMWFARLMEPVVTPAAQKHLEKNLAKLKRLVEATP
jgi:carbon monoxide dehydrogenase subunit G